MSFDTALLELTGTASDSHDIKATVRRCYFYDLDGYALRLWDGMGVMTAGGYEWQGTVTPEGRNLHQTPAVHDGRDGTSPRYEFSMPYIDKATYDAMKADQDIARGQQMTCYHALFSQGDGLIVTEALKFNYRLTIQGLKFAEETAGDLANLVTVRGVTALMRSGEVGRSRTPNGTYTDTAQRERARVLGVTSDSGCIYVAGNSQRTYVIDGS